MRKLLSVIGLCIVLMSVWSCRKEKKEVFDQSIDPETHPTMTTTDVNTVISDSGILRYRILAPTWLMFDEAKDPKWRFPLGMHMERYDNFKKINATIDCDSATYLTQKDIWELNGAVDIHSADGQRFLTEQLFWNRTTRRVYTDSFIHIRRPDRIVEGYGLRSNDQFTDYEILRPTGSFPVSQFEQQREQDTYGAATPMGVAPAQDEPQPADTVAADTIQVAPEPDQLHKPRRLRPLRMPKNRPDTTQISQQ